LAKHKKDEDKALVISVSITDPKVKTWVQGIINDETRNLSKSIQAKIKEGI